MKVIVLAIVALLCTSCASNESVEAPHDRLAVDTDQLRVAEAPEAFLRFYALGMSWQGEHASSGLVFALWKNGEFVRAASPEDPGRYSCVRGYISPQDRTKLIEGVRNAVLRIPKDSYIPFDSNGYVLTYRGETNCVGRCEWVDEKGALLGSGGESPGTESVLHRLASVAFSLALNRSDALDNAPLLHETDWGCDNQDNRAVSSQAQAVD
jgi:hypothetical protein